MTIKVRYIKFFSVFQKSGRPKAMLGKSRLICLLILILSVAACEKHQKSAPSKVNVDSSHSTKRELEEVFQQKVNKLKSIITAGELSIGRDYRQYSFWAIPIMSADGLEVLATFYFKKNENNVGPDINVEFSDSGEMVSFYLNSYISARAAFTADNPEGKIRTSEALDLLQKKADKKESPKILKQIAANLKDLSKFLEHPSITKKFVGQDPTGKACYVHTTNDLSGNTIKVKVGYMNQENGFPKLNFYLGPFKFEVDNCSELEFDSTKQNAFSKYKLLLGYGITYERQRTEPSNGIGTLTGSQTRAGLYGGMVLSGTGCQTTKLTLCHDRAQIQRVSFGAGSVSLLPFLGGGMKENISIDCRTLIPME